MKAYRRADPAVIVIFGAGGDLTWRKLVPALYNLYLDKWLAEKFAVIGVDAKVGQGRVLLFGAEILQRAQPHGTFKFLFNGIWTK